MTVNDVQMRTKKKSKLPRPPVTAFLHRNAPPLLAAAPNMIGSVRVSGMVVRAPMRLVSEAKKGTTATMARTVTATIADIIHQLLLEPEAGEALPKPSKESISPRQSAIELIEKLIPTCTKRQKLATRLPSEPKGSTERNSCGASRGERIIMMA